MLGCTGNFLEKESELGDVEEGPQDVYVHGYVSGRVFKIAGEGNTGGDGEEEEEGVPVTIAASYVPSSNPLPQPPKTLIITKQKPKVS
jgi:hypothetical protein